MRGGPAPLGVGCRYLRWWRKLTYWRVPAGKQAIQMATLKLMTVVGARPQFIKAAVISRAIVAHNRVASHVVVEEEIVHTGQHYD
jgi:hypothetical protein